MRGGFAFSSPNVFLSWQLLFGLTFTVKQTRKDYRGMCVPTRAMMDSRRGSLLFTFSFPNIFIRAQRLYGESIIRGKDNTPTYILDRTGIRSASKGSLRIPSSIESLRPSVLGKGYKRRPTSTRRIPFRAKYFLPFYPRVLSDATRCTGNRAPLPNLSSILEISCGAGNRG